MAGGGVGEAMLIGAAVGAGTGGVMSAVKDEDPLQGALLGAALGAAGGGIGSFAGGAASGAASGAAEGAVTSQLPQSAISSALASDATKAAALQGVQSSIPSISSSTSLLGPGGSAIPGIGSAAPSGLGNLTAGQYTGLFGQAPQPGAALSQGLTQAPAQTSASGLGTGMFPKLTNAQAYGAGIGGGLMGLVGQSAQNQDNMAPEPEPYTGPLSYFKYSPQTFRPSVAPGYADGGIASLGPQTGMYPQSQYDKTQFATPSQMPISREVIGSDYDARISPYTGDMMMASGGISSLGSYSDGGRMLKGPGDGMSDDIPGVIAGKQPARLADGEFVVPADVVSHLGNGSTDAGAKKLYSMMDSVRKARTGSKKQGRQIKADKYVPGMARGGRVEDGIMKLAGGGEWTDPYTVPTTQGGFLDVGNTNGVSADQVQAMIDATRKTTAGISSDFQPSGYTPSDRYTPYTMSGRPSSSEPQFYGNIYQPTYENYALPEYNMSAGLGRWGNITQGPQFDESTYLQNKLTQLSGLPVSDQTRMFDESTYLQNKLQQLKGTEFENYNPQQLKNYIASQGMTLPQHYEQWGKSEGIANPYREYTAPELKTVMAQYGMTPAQHYQQWGRSEGISNPYTVSSPPTPSLSADIASTQAAKEEPAKTEKKRRGGIASLVS